MKKSNLIVRSGLNFKLSTLREEDMSVEFVLSTETPARVADYERWEMIDEVLIASGVQIPESGKIPLQDSHSRDTVLDNLGHVAEIRTENDQVVGRLYFDKNDEKAVKAFRKVQAGHLDSGSVGYTVLEKQRVAKDEKVNFNGKEYVGQIQISKKWALKEYSLVAVGADPFAKARSDENNFKEKNNMPPENVVPENNVLAEAQKRAAEMETKALESLKIAERKMTDASIIELCARHGLQGDAKKLIDSAASFEDAQRAVIDVLASRTEKTAVSSASVVIVGGMSSDEKKRDEIIRGIMLKGGVEISNDRNMYRERTLLEIGAECFELQGINTKNWTKSELARKIITASRAAVATDMTTASFSNITENVVQKTAMKGFAAQPKVWDLMCDIGSTDDFKDVSRVGLSENADLPFKKEGAEYRESKFADRKESGAVGTYADSTTLTEESLINDSVQLLTKIPMYKGAAAARVPETLFFGKVNTPPTLTATSKAWFSTTNDNSNDLFHIDGFNASNLAAAVSAMRKMKPPVHSSETTTEYLNIMPKYCMVHTDYEMTARTLLESPALPQVDMSSGVINPLSRMGLIPVPTPNITTSTNFYLFADKNLYPSLEMLFLNGRVAPEVFIDESTNIDGIRFRIRIRVGIIVQEWRTALRFRKAAA